MLNIIFEKNMAIELLAALVRYTYDDTFTKEFRSAGYQSDQKISEWVRNTRQNISGYLDGEIKNLFSQSLMNGLFLQKIIINGDIEDCTGLFEALSVLDGRAYVASVCESLSLQDSADQDTMVAAIQATNDRKTAVRLIEMINNPNETLERIITAIRKFHDSFFLPVIVEASGIIDEKSGRYIEMSQEERAGFVKSMINTDLSAWGGDFTLSMFVSHFYEASANMIKCTGKACVAIVFGYQIVEMASEEALEKRRRQIYKVLADDKRLEILRLICKRSWFGNELAKQLNITTATLSYHISKLFELGVVNFKDGEANRIYYSADSKKLKELFEKALNDILN